jgi:hypothetical protein
MNELAVMHRDDQASDVSEGDSAEALVLAEQDDRQPRQQRGRGQAENRHDRQAAVVEDRVELGCLPRNGSFSLL